MSQLKVRDLMDFSFTILDDDVCGAFVRAVNASNRNGVCLIAELRGHLNGARVELVRFLKEQAMPPASPFANEEEWVSGVNSALAA